MFIERVTQSHSSGDISDECDVLQNTIQRHNHSKPIQLLMSILHPDDHVSRQCTPISEIRTVISCINAGRELDSPKVRLHDASSCLEVVREEIERHIMMGTCS
jgi:hypothetical protein